MNNQVTFARLDAVLADLGFEKQVVRGSHVNYRHAAFDPPMKIRLHKPKDLVPGYVLLATRRELENFGIIAGEQFDELLQAAAA